MASVLFGGGVSLVVGKHGGSAFQRRRGGNIIRTKVLPINPGTLLSGPSRTFLSFLSHFWSNNLTPIQVASWNTYATTSPVMNRVGQVTTLSGQQIFFKLNMNLLSTGNPMIVNPPITGAVGTVTSFTIGPNTALGGSINATVVIGTPTVNDVAIIKLTPSVSQGRNYVSSQYRSMLIQLANGVTTNVVSQWRQFFGSTPSAGGQKLIGLAHVLNTATGVVSAEFKAQGTWV